MPAVDEVVIIEPFGAAATIDAQDLPYPAHFAVGLDADREVQDLVRFIGKVEGFAIFEVTAIAPVHAARVAELFEIDGLAADLLPELAELLLALHSFAVVEIGGFDARLQWDGHSDGWRIMQKFDLLHFPIQIADNFEVGHAVGFAGFNEVFKDFLCVLLGVQQLDDLGHAIIFRIGFITLFDVLSIADADAKACNVVFVGAEHCGRMVDSRTRSCKPASS